MQENLLLLIRKCRLNQEEAHELVYDSFFDVAESISADYSNDMVEQLEIINLGFRKAFKYIHHFNADSRNLSEDFQEWIRKMMIYAAVGYFRNNFKLSYFLNFDYAEISNHIKKRKNNSRFSVNAIKMAISQLPPSSKLVMNLTTIQGFNEQELAQCLEISLQRAQSLLFEATSRFNELLLADKEIAHGACHYNNREEMAENSVS
ncbi:MAG: sigma-70 family RNA polymerase sigma factor [Chitinophagales bacterium]|nr:sigma-70 family RNA polymerase sigma factor [Chitinophagales bacterium]